MLVFKGLPGLFFLFLDWRGLRGEDSFCAPETFEAKDTDKTSVFSFTQLVRTVRCTGDRPRPNALMAMLAFGFLLRIRRRRLKISSFCSI